MRFREANREFESWLRAQTPLVAADLAYKHAQMRLDAFRFFRATFFRFAQTWREHFPELEAIPLVPSVGDAHLENFGTWRTPGGLVWGINDFDEAGRYPYAFDLVRLATSALIAIDSGVLPLTPRAACDEILDGYASAIRSGGRPFRLEKHRWLREHAQRAMPTEKRFLEGLEKDLGPPSEAVPAEALKVLRAPFPDLTRGEVHQRFRAGLGSLGRPRFVVMRSLEGQSVVQEVKRLVPSAGRWAGLIAERPKQREVIGHAVRDQDPKLHFSARWVGRRLGPDAIRIELKHVTGEAHLLQLLGAMGFETGNVHLGDAKACQRATEHINRQPKGWLERAAQVAVGHVSDELADWQKEA